jgi:tRNA(Ile)-lysidine synthase
MKSIEQKVIKFVDHFKLLQNGNKVLIALSGGPDSVFSLYFFNKFSKRFGITLAAAHLNHMLRGKQADKDEEFCKKICTDSGIEFFSEKRDVAGYARQNKISVEEAARKMRYEFLTHTQWMIMPKQFY